MKLEQEIVQKKFESEYHKLAVNVVFTYNWLFEIHSKIFKSYDLTIQQFNVLRILRGQHPKATTVKLIRERMLDKMSDASRIVEKLRLKGLVERNLSAEDRRNVDVMITKKGLNLLAKIDKNANQVEQQLSNLNKKEAKELNDLLDKLRG